LKTKKEKQKRNKKKEKKSTEKIKKVTGTRSNGPARNDRSP
jgi:hypothetical protein